MRSQNAKRHNARKAFITAQEDWEQPYPLSVVCFATAARDRSVWCHPVPLRASRQIRARVIRLSKCANIPDVRLPGVPPKRKECRRDREVSVLILSVSQCMPLRVCA